MYKICTDKIPISGTKLYVLMMYRQKVDMYTYVYVSTRLQRHLPCDILLGHDSKCIVQEESLTSNSDHWVLHALHHSTEPAWVRLDGTFVFALESH